MEDIVVYFLFFLFLVIWAITIYSIYRNNLLSKREKANLVFINVVLPIAGSFIYYFFLKNKEKQ
ncbi:MAG: hypothetical protein QM726_10050 [Chitinophagaceae bacterium]